MQEEKRMIIANIIALILVLVGCINWGLVGIFDWNLVSAIFGVGTILSTIVYILVLLSAIWLVVALCMEHGRISFRRD